MSVSELVVFCQYWNSNLVSSRPTKQTGASTNT